MDPLVLGLAALTTPNSGPQFLAIHLRQDPALSKALPLPQARQRPRVPDAKSTRIPASRFNPLHAPQVMQSAVNFPDGLLGICALRLSN